MNDEELALDRARWAFKAGLAEGTLLKIRDILKDVEEFCDKHDEDDPVVCGWKSAMKRVRRVMEGYEFTQVRPQTGDPEHEGYRVTIRGDGTEIRGWATYEALTHLATDTNAPFIVVASPLPQASSEED